MITKVIAAPNVKVQSGQAILKYGQLQCRQDAKPIHAHLKLAPASGVKKGSMKQSKGTGEKPKAATLNEAKKPKAKKATGKRKDAKPKSKKPAAKKAAAKPKKAKSPKKKATEKPKAKKTPKKK